ncbi:hypothetical protein LU293_08090 [Moraxella nasovis]|uniref:hypothetical protein n=1 Tax=Moraxella nasovis TaxID=2904121 RepID=UPI001F60F22D|nr:hypothetical protein [Moraxella nasovis]UNU73033.1 hypothetical protein LU293_08090 [Moraxella nasovis]
MRQQNLVGISQLTCQALESDKVQKTAYLAKIAHTLKVSPDWLFTGKTRCLPSQALSIYKHRQMASQSPRVNEKKVVFCPQLILNQSSAGWWQTFGVIANL